ncbi:hypothetical protein CA54_43270 [Symmachiella macrocystis]|uniref:Uncharacterized protein n=1 Tax=Symmachiella macrocystis TaxID=2527985 RepID=A0A5C6BBI9_9PLAN|nr:hypothetical protein CA54_43270 [Symmachiella macrocystis]
MAFLMKYREIVFCTIMRKGGSLDAKWKQAGGRIGLLICLKSHSRIIIVHSGDTEYRLTNALAERMIVRSQCGVIHYP